METDAKEIIIKGINASPGICIGKAYLVDREGVDIVEKYRIQAKDLSGEIKRFKAAVKKAKDELRKIVEKSPEELQHAHILETHMALLKDKMLYGRTIETVKQESVNAEWALKKVVSNLIEVFQTMTDPYLKERSADVVQVADSIMHNLVGAKKVNIAAIENASSWLHMICHRLKPARSTWNGLWVLLPIEAAKPLTPELLHAALKYRLLSDLKTLPQQFEMIISLL